MDFSRFSLVFWFISAIDCIFWSSSCLTWVIVVNFCWKIFFSNSSYLSLRSIRAFVFWVTLISIFSILWAYFSCLDLYYYKIPIFRVVISLLIIDSFIAKNSPLNCPSSLLHSMVYLIITLIEVSILDPLSKSGLSKFMYLYTC